jgi:hypothetical protein
MTRNTNRQKAHVDGVLAKGGSRRTFLLSPEATKGLARWRECIGARSDKEAIELAILKALCVNRGQ